MEAAHSAGGLLQDLLKTPDWHDFVPSQVVFLDRQYLSELLHQVSKTLISGTNKEKGDSLEELAEYLLNSCGIFNVEAKKNTATGELDRYIKVVKIPGTFLDEWPIYVPVECKNWNNPIGPNEIDRLHEKAQNMRSNRGIMFSSNGVTGKIGDGKDGWGEIRNQFSREGYITIVIDLKDLDSITKGTCPLEIIEKRQREIHLSA